MAKAANRAQNTAEMVRVGVVGHGVVGSAFTALVARQQETIAARNGITLEVVRIAVRDAAKHPSRVGTAVVSTDPLAVATADDVDLVVEVMGGTALASDVIRTALEHGKPVVTANKALLAAQSADLFKIADERGIDLLFEAAVCGGIPLIRPLRESLRGEPIRRVLGIVNGTTNFILTRMTEDGLDYAAALRGAQELGYAEADPTADVEGLDAAAKIAIVANFAFGVHVVVDDVAAEGISKITAGVRHIVVDSFDELDRIDALVSGGLPAPRVQLRITPGVYVHTHEFISTGQNDSKFGFNLANGDAERAIHRARRWTSSYTKSGVPCCAASSCTSQPPMCSRPLFTTDVSGNR
ncbi:MAG: homoserine dehydrogenase [Actinomycetota bacterium]